MRIRTAVIAVALVTACSASPESTSTSPASNRVTHPAEDTLFAQTGIRGFELSGLDTADYSFHAALQGDHPGDVLVRPSDEGVQFDLNGASYARFTLADGSTAARFAAGGQDLFIEQTKSATGDVTRTRFFATNLATRVQSILVVESAASGTEPEIQTWLDAAGVTPAFASPDMFKLMVLNQDPSFANAVASFLSASTPTFGAADISSRLRLQGSEDDPVCSGLLEKITLLSGFALASCVACPSFIAALGVSLGTTAPVSGTGAVVACPLCAGALMIDVGTLITCFIRNITSKSSEQCAAECSGKARGATGAWNGRTRECTCLCDDTLCRSSSLHSLGPGVKLCAAGCADKTAFGCHTDTSVCGDGVVQNTAGCTEACDGPDTCPGGQHCAADCSGCVAPRCGDGYLDSGEACDFNGCGPKQHCASDCGACVDDQPNDCRIIVVFSHPNRTNEHVDMFEGSTCADRDAGKPGTFIGTYTPKNPIASPSQCGAYGVRYYVETGEHETKDQNSKLVCFDVPIQSIATQAVQTHD